MEASYILAENLSIALITTIRERAKAEKELGYTSDSGYLAGLKKNLEAVENGTLQIKY